MLRLEAERAISLKELTANARWVKLYEMIVSSFSHKMKIDRKYWRKEGMVQKFSTSELL